MHVEEKISHVVVQRWFLLLCMRCCLIGYMNPASNADFSARISLHMHTEPHHPPLPPHLAVCLPRSMGNPTKTATRIQTLAQRANGMQTYSLGWMRYAGEGPETASDSPTVPVNITGNNNTASSNLGKGGVAGSSIPENGWLAGVDVITMVFGVLTAAGHLAGFAFYTGALFMVQLLFRSQFRSDRCVFRAVAKGSVALLVWVVGVGVVGFYLSAQESFTGSVLETLHNEGFLCQVMLGQRAALAFHVCRCSIESFGTNILVGALDRTRWV